MIASSATTIEPLAGDDLVALAQCSALDAEVFPYASLPWLTRTSVPVIWLARAEDPTRRRPVLGFAAIHRHPSKLVIVGLAVDAAHRRSGLARRLLDAVIADARRHRIATVSLTVSTANHGALRLYESSGFARVRRLPGFYARHRFAENGDAWLMSYAVT